MDKAIYRHCEAVYQRMVEQSKTEFEGHKLWEGHLTKLITKELRLSVPYYTSITQALKRMDCIRQLKRGGGGSTSQWVLLQPPTPEMFETSTVSSGYGGKTETRVVQMLKDLNERVTDLERKTAP